MYRLRINDWIKKTTVALLLLVCSFALQAQCWMSDLAADLAKPNASETFKDVIKNDPDGFVAYKCLHNLDDATLHMDGTLLAHLADDLKDAKFAEGFLGKLKKNPKLVEAWERLRDLSAGKVWVRKNVKILEKISGESDEVIIKLKDMYSKFHAPKNFDPPGVYNKIYFDDYGFPNFSKYISDKSHIVDIAVDGSNEDYLKAYKKLKKKLGKGRIQFDNSSGSSFIIKGENGKWSEVYTWHHHENGKSMIPVLQSMHRNAAHTGGRATASRGLIDLFKLVLE